MTSLLQRLSLITACLLVMQAFAGNGIAVAQSSLPQCSTAPDSVWNMCIGTEFWSNGDKFVGEYKNHRRNGFGTFTSANGESYVGEFKDDKFNGQGTYTGANGEKYVGEFMDDKFSGQGTYTFPDGEKYVGEFKDDKRHGQGTSIFPSGNKYVGEFKDDKKNGQGTYTFADGGKYVGEFKDDNKSGQGTLIFGDGQHKGHVYSGEFKDDKFNGQGTYTLANGDKYVGEFKEDEPNGQGTFAWVTGDKYVGVFRDSKSNGQFTVSYANGDNFSGRYQSEMRDGQGTYRWVDGSKYVGQWKDGLPTNDGILTNPAGAIITGAQYKSAAVYGADGYMSSPDVLTYSGGTVQQPVVLAPSPQQQPNTTSDNLRKVALVIGNSGYQHAAPLENPHNDAEAMTSLLKNIGFDVVSGTDLDKRATEQKIADFVDRAAQADVSLFFYAGHGIQVAGENFIVPVDAKVEKASAIDFELVNVSMVTSYMGGERSIGIALLDACRDNPFTRSLSRALGNRSNQVNTGLAELRSAGGGLLVGFATAPGDVAADGAGMNNSPFTTALLRHLATKGLEVELMMKRVKADVIEITKNQQRPWTNSDLAKEVYLAGPSDGSVPSAYDSIEENTKNSNGGAEQELPPVIIAPPANNPTQ
jgi:hypothetical protein